MKAKVLATCGAAYIDTDMYKALQQAGVEPATFDNLSTGYEWAVRRGPLQVCDVGDAERAAAAMKHHAVTAVLRSRSSRRPVGPVPRPHSMLQTTRRAAS